MTEETRSRQGALDTLLSLRDKVAAHITDDTGRGLFTEQLITDVFREAWRNQFEDQRSEFRAKLKATVGDAIEAAKLGGTKQ